ncbi:AlpA family transcriptional regulator [Micrococcus sp. TA1]|uniref:helix-turn-helix transcriptional regulator n=1 Tax=Micrococcus sp. TA1 TaxID=681627 RepID=UPI00161073C1|nr:helix-turn-helix domain-containing protein [Micrococcus sp. TA1]MBB5747932.1 putative DNA-binding transcriptional regulator AlpA [Micrococcus sp. TA1]
MADTRLYTGPQLAEYLGTTAGTLAYWRYMGRGPKFIKLGRSVRYRESDVNAWLDSQAREQTGERASA